MDVRWFYSLIRIEVKAKTRSTKNRWHSTEIMSAQRQAWRPPAAAPERNHSAAVRGPAEALVWRFFGVAN
jgi:hypothetical protein